MNAGKSVGITTGCLLAAFMVTGMAAPSYAQDSGPCPNSSSSSKTGYLTHLKYGRNYTGYSAIQRQVQVIRKITFKPAGFVDEPVTMDYNEWISSGKWKKGGPGQGSYGTTKWTGPDGVKHSSPQAGWEDYSGQDPYETQPWKESSSDNFEAAKQPVEAAETIEVGGDWWFTLGSRTAYRHTEYDRGIMGNPTLFGRPISPLGGRDDADSHTLMETLSFTLNRGAFTTSLIVPIEREEFKGPIWEKNDNTRVGVILAPSYQILRRDVHGFDLDVGIHTGYHHICYDHGFPAGARAPVVGARVPGPGPAFNDDNPDFYTLGFSVGGEVPLPLGSLGASFMQTWAWDIGNDNQLAGNNYIDFQDVMTRYRIPFSKHFYGAVGLNWSYANDLPSGWDDCTFRHFVEVGYNKNHWAAGFNFSHDLWDQNVNECTYAFQLSYSW